jgi:hypothetical protein
MVFCAIFCEVLFYKGSNMWGRNIDSTKVEAKAKVEIFLLMH